MSEPTQQPSTTTAVATATETRRKHIPLIVDVYRGAVRGDYAPEMGIPGYTTQALVGFIPVVGTCCALRDFMADRKKKDNFGALLNGLALIPFLGGFPKTARAIRSVRSIGGSAQYVTNVERRLRK
jgi:hypothetical protein